VVERDDLFPAGEVHNPEKIWRDRNVFDPAHRVSIDEVVGVIRGRRRGGYPAPGPDGLSLDIWKRVLRCVIGGLAELYS